MDEKRQDANHRILCKLMLIADMRETDSPLVQITWKLGAIDREDNFTWLHVRLVTLSINRERSFQHASWWGIFAEPIQRRRPKLTEQALSSARRAVGQ